MQSIEIYIVFIWPDVNWEEITCQSVVHSYNKTELYVWKGRSLCVEEITQWKYKTSSTQCGENYAECGTNLYCVANINKGATKCPIDGIDF